MVRYLSLPLASVRTRWLWISEYALPCAMIAFGSCAFSPLWLAENTGFMSVLVSAPRPPFLCARKLSRLTVRITLLRKPHWELIHLCTGPHNMGCEMSNREVISGLLLSRACRGRKSGVLPPRAKCQHLSRADVVHAAAHKATT